MKFMSARRAISTGIVAAASVAALAAPGAANAALPGHCKGITTEGAGSSLQAEAQAIWDPGFEVNKVGCPSGPKVTYRSIGSGAGYKEWNEKEHFGTVGFVGTDNTVNQSEKESVEKKATLGSSTLETIPVLQGAVSVVVNLPAECSATSAIASNRLALNDSTLEEIYAGKITNWNELNNVENAGNKLTGAGCNSTITPVVRKDGSGTTHIFKRFLNEIFNGVLASEDGLNHTWGELAEGSLSTKWPTAAKVLHAAEETGPGLLKTVASTPGSIGYANLADSRNVANGGFTGQSASRFWVELEASKKSKNGKTSRKYTDPSTNGDSATVSASNCKDTVYSNGSAAFPPPAVSSPWNEVTAETTSKTYALCGLTYNLVLTNYEAYTGGSAGEAQSVVDFENYVLSKKGGQKEIKNKDYNELPKGLVSESLEGIEKITG